MATWAMSYKQTRHTPDSSLLTRTGFHVTTTHPVVLMYKWNEIENRLKEDSQARWLGVVLWYRELSGVEQRQLTEGGVDLTAVDELIDG